jgi:hypothetical protein
LYYLGLSLGSTSKALELFIERSYVAIWYSTQEFNANNVFPNKKKNRITATFIIDENNGSDRRWQQTAWLWVVAVAIIEPIHHRILKIYILRHRNMLVADQSFLKTFLIKLFGKHIVYILIVDHGGILKLAIL